MTNATSLEAPSETFRLLVESVKDYAIFMLDPTGHVLTWNRGAEHIKGYSAAEILGRHFSLFYPPEDAAKCDAELEIAARDGRVEEEGWRARAEAEAAAEDVALNSIDMAAHHLIRRVRYGGGLHIDRDRTNLHDVCREVLSDLELQGKADRIRFEPDGPGHGRWDRDRLLQVVQNLLENALRYAAPDSEVHLRVRREKPGVVRLCVHNDGPPIPADVLRTFHVYLPGLLG